MAPKKTNIKIKRSKINLYNKKKNKARRVLKIVITVVIVCGLAVLGYGLGKPLLKYLREKDQNSSQPGSTTSELMSSVINSQDENTSGESAADTVSDTSDVSGSNTSDTSEPQVQTADSIYYLPDNAAVNEASLTEALTAAKDSGCSAVAVTLKDTTGALLYKTDIAGVKDTSVVTGTLTAAQIAEKISSAGFKPAAKINTLMDRQGALYVEGNFELSPSQGGGCWLDNSAANGGKTWLSPFKEQSVQYIGNITSELSKAGFKYIVCANTRYPAFHGVDITMYLNNLPLSDSAKRTAALWNVINSAKTSAENNGAEILLEISGTNLIADSKDCTDAEFTADKEKLKTVRLTVNYDVTGKVTTTSDTSSNANESADYKNAKNFAAKAKAALGDAEFSVHLPQTLTGKALEDVNKAFSEAGITVL